MGLHDVSAASTECRLVLGLVLWLWRCDRVRLLDLWLDLRLNLAWCQSVHFSWRLASIRDMNLVLRTRIGHDCLWITPINIGLKSALRYDLTSSLSMRTIDSSCLLLLACFGLQGLSIIGWVWSNMSCWCVWCWSLFVETSSRAFSSCLIVSADVEKLRWGCATSWLDNLVLVADGNWLSLRSVLSCWCWSVLGGLS